jgi:Asp-tRNA(Asn)/Glu-tRNA(Gln) amidotransferase C subunit
MTIDRGIQGNKVFVYGCEVDDFHILDKSYIFTLNVCATQELSRQLDDITQQVEQLESILHISPTDYMSIL